MGKYDKFSITSRQQARPWDVHPIWRGIGCLLFLIGPFIAFAGAHLLIDINIEQGWFPIPREMAAPFTIPQVNYTLQHFYASLLVTVLLLIAGFTVIMVIYGALYSILGPRRYGPLDSPPVRRVGKRRR